MMAKSNRRRDEERRAAAAARVAEMQRAQQAAERRRRTLLVSAVGIAVIAVIVATFVVIQLAGSSTAVAARAVRGSTPNYGFVVGKPGAPATMVAYEDFQCPICKQFEDTDGSMLQKDITAGKLKIEYRPIAFLNQMSEGNMYSTRSLNAAACVSNFTNSQTWKLFHDLLYKDQPAENTPGRTDAQLVTYAKQAGATSPAVASCIMNQTFKDWTASATDAASKAGVSGTPTVLLDGKNVSINTLANTAQVSKLIDAAVASNTK
ncbi:MAG: hypothetical protein QOI06_12 [Nocardioidaceae bacterium]|jgi:protein-disulfide isomerase|nr:hypothetical protein [Nocardioidaceae bacterium]